MGLIGSKRKGWSTDAISIREATHLLCTTTGYMDDVEDDDGNPIPYAIEGRVYKIEDWRNPGRKDGKIFIHSECCQDNNYGSHNFPSDMKELAELGFIPIKRIG